jgi:predicted nucleotidyltransferase
MRKDQVFLVYPLAPNALRLKICNILSLNLFPRSFIIESTMLSEAEIEKIRSVVSSRRGVAYAILFGSALKRLRAHSDIDLMVEGELSPVEKADLLMELAIQLGRQIDLISPKEALCDVVLRAFSSGIPILVRDRERVKEDYLKNYRLCDQRDPLKRIRQERVKRVYRNG